MSGGTVAAKPPASSSTIQVGKGRTFAVGGSGASTSATPSASSQPTGPSLDRAAATAQAKAESRARYQQGNAPQSTWTDARGNSYRLDPKDERIDSLRRQLDHERWMNRDLRQRRYYGDYYGMPGPTVVYRDSFSSFFWMWLLAQSIDTRSNWAYHHRYDMDPQRYSDLLARDRDLEARIRALEQQEAQGKITRSRSWKPEGMDPDLMYTDEYVDAVYNPQPAPTAGTASAPSATHSAPPVVYHPRAQPHSSAAATLFKVFLVFAVMILLIWLIFFKRWGGA